MSETIQISEDRLIFMLTKASELGAEKALRRLTKELNLERTKWLNKSQTLEILSISEKQLQILVIVGAIKTNDAGKGKVIHYDKRTVLAYLENPAKWDDVKKFYHQNKSKL